MSHLSEAERKFELRQPITPYVCSTPDDFHEERDWLTRHIFPKLAEMCVARGTYFAPVDIRWSDDDTVTQEGHLLHSLLDLIKQSAPYFLCLLGERYGPYRSESKQDIGSDSSMEQSDGGDWLELNLRLAAECGHQWVMQGGHEYCSIPELEIMAATLRGSSHQCTFYFRQAEHLDMKMEYATREECLDLSARYLAESDHAGLKVQGLKQTIVKRGLPVRYFKTPQELGEIVTEDWFAILDTVCPPLEDNGQFLDTAHYQQWVAREALLTRLRSEFVESQDTELLVSQVNEFALSAIDEQPYKPEEDQEDSDNDNESRSAISIFRQKPPPPPSYQTIMLVNGDRGVGKSVGLAHWLQEFTEENPGIFLIHHFIGAAPGDNDIAAFLRQCTRDLRKHFLLTEVTGPAELDDSSSWWSEEDMDTPADFSMLCQAFVAALGLGPCILLLDGINNLGGTCGLTQQEVKEFEWLPASLPRHSRIIFSTSRADVTYRSLCRRGDVNFLTVGGIKGSTLKMSHLEKSVKPHVLPFVKTKWKQVSEMRVLTSPLALCVLGTELNEHSIFTQLDDFLEKHYETTALHTFFTHTIQDWVTQFSWSRDEDSSDVSKDDGLFDYSGWVADALSLIAVSRGGLRQDELLELLPAMGYTGPLEVTVLQWLRFRLRAGALLWETADGCIRFAHRHLQDITEYNLLRAVSASDDVATINNAPQLSSKRRIHMQLALHFGKQPLSWRQAQELPWHLTMAGDMNELLAYLTNNSVVHLYLARRDDYPDGHHDLRYYWSVLDKVGFRPGPHYLRMLKDMGLNVLPSAASQMSVHSAYSVESWLEGQVGSTVDPEDTDLEEGTERAESEKHFHTRRRKTPSPVTITLDTPDEAISVKRRAPWQLEDPEPAEDNDKKSSLGRKVGLMMPTQHTSGGHLLPEYDTSDSTRPSRRASPARVSRLSTSASSSASVARKISNQSRLSVTVDDSSSRKPSLFSTRKVSLSPLRIHEVLMSTAAPRQSQEAEQVPVRRPASWYHLPPQYQKEVPEKEEGAKGHAHTRHGPQGKRGSGGPKRLSSSMDAPKKGEEKKSSLKPRQSQQGAVAFSGTPQRAKAEGGAVNRQGVPPSRTNVRQGHGGSPAKSNLKPKPGEETSGRALAQSTSRLKPQAVHIEYVGEDIEDSTEAAISRELHATYPFAFTRRVSSAPAVRGARSKHSQPSILRQPGESNDLTRPISGTKLKFVKLMEKDEVEAMAKEKVLRPASAPQRSSREMEPKIIGNSIRLEFFLTSTQPMMNTQDLLDGLDSSRKKDVVAELSWGVGRFLQEVKQVEDARTILFCLHNYLQANYPLSLPTQLLEIRVLERLGTICFAARDFQTAMAYYHQALRMTFDLDCTDDGLCDHRQVDTFKGVLLGHHGYIRLLEGDVLEAGELLKEATENISHLTGNHVLRAALLFHLGLFRGQLGELARAQATLRQCLALRRQWHGQLHPEVATVLLALARLNNIIYGIKPDDNDQRQETQKLYRKAVAVSERCLGPSHLQVAEILAELGELVAEEEGRIAKMEARRLLQRTLDIRTTELGADDCSTKAARASVRRVELALQPGHVDPALLARPDHAQHISLMPQRDMRLPFMGSRAGAGSRMSSSPTKSEQFGGLDIRSVSREKVLLHNRPDSMLSSAFSSAADRLLATRPMSSKGKGSRVASAGSSAFGARAGSLSVAWSGKTATAPVEVRVDLDEEEEEGEKLCEGGEEGGIQVTSTPRGQRDKPRTVVVDLGLDQDELEEEERARHQHTPAAVDENPEEPETPHLDTFALHLQDGTIIIGEEPRSKPRKTVKVRPQSTPHSLFQHYASIADGSRVAQATPKPRPRSQRSLGQGPRSWSARTTASSVGSHVSRCSLPGPHDIYPKNDTSSLTGPNADIASLLGPPVCPRDNVHPEVHHRSAFYHVPGRYATAVNCYPPRRSQKTEGARILDTVMATKLQVVSRQHARYGATPPSSASPHPIGVNQQDVTMLVRRTGVNRVESRGRAILASARGDSSPDLPRVFGTSAVKFSEPITVS